MAGWPSPVRHTSKQSAGSTGEAIHVSPVRVIHRSRSRSREASTDRELKIELPGTVGPRHTTDSQLESYSRT